MPTFPAETGTPLEQLCTELIETFLPEEALRQYIAGDIGKAHLEPIAATIKALSGAYVGERTAGLSKITATEAIAYALYFTPINYTKVYRLLGTLDPEFSPKRILDFGCGPGTASIAALDRFDQIAHIDVVDTASAMLDSAELLLARHNKKNSTNKTKFTFSANQNVADNYDLIIAANCLNEMPHDKAISILDRFAKSLTPNGTLLLIEPALQEITRKHMSLRDWIVKNHPDLTVIFPCTRNDACPMLNTSPSDWCHGTISWERPRLTVQLDRLTEFNKHRIKYSAFLFQRNAQLSKGLRVILPTERNKHSFMLTGCGNNFYGLVTLKKRDKSEANATFTKAEQYDRLVVLGLIDGQIGTCSNIYCIEKP